MTKTTDQRRAYALRRMCLAVDRQIRCPDPATKKALGRWVLIWAKIARIRY